MITQNQLHQTHIYVPGTGSFLSRRSLRCVGSQNHEGYWSLYINKKSHRVHRLVFLYMTGVYPTEEVDHINGDPSDNRWTNLRLCTKEDNMRNAKLRTDNKSGLAGVSWRKEIQKWRVRIGSNEGCNTIGHYTDFFEACCARKSAELKLGYHANHGRKLASDPQTARYTGHI